MEQEKKVVKKKTNETQKRKNNTTKKYNSIKKKSITSNKKTNKEQIVIPKETIEKNNNIEESNTKEEVKKSKVFSKIKIIAIILCIGLVYYLIDSPVVKKNEKNSVHEETNVEEVSVGDNEYGCSDESDSVLHICNGEFYGYDGNCWIFCQDGAMLNNGLPVQSTGWCPSGCQESTIRDSGLSYCFQQTSTQPYTVCTKCSPGKVLNANKQCEACPVGQVPNSDQTGCIADTCTIVDFTADRLHTSDGYSVSYSVSEGCIGKIASFSGVYASAGSITISSTSGSVSVSASGHSGCVTSTITMSVDGSSASASVETRPDWSTYSGCWRRDQVTTSNSYTCDVNGIDSYYDSWSQCNGGFGFTQYHVRGCGYNPPPPEEKNPGCCYQNGNYAYSDDCPVAVEEDATKCDSGCYCKNSNPNDCQTFEPGDSKLEWTKQDNDSKCNSSVDDPIVCCNRGGNYDTITTSSCNNANGIIESDATKCDSGCYCQGRNCVTIETGTSKSGWNYESDTTKCDSGCYCKISDPNDCGIMGTGDSKKDWTKQDNDSKCDSSVDDPVKCCFTIKDGVYWNEYMKESVCLANGWGVSSSTTCTNPCFCKTDDPTTCRDQADNATTDGWEISPSCGSTTTPPPSVVITPEPTPIPTYSFCCGDGTNLSNSNEVYWKENTTSATCDRGFSIVGYDENACSLSFCCGDSSNFNSAKDVTWVTGQTSRVCPRPYSSWSAYGSGVTHGMCQINRFCCADAGKLSDANNTEWQESTSTTCKNPKYSKITSVTSAKDCNIDYCCGNNSDYKKATEVTWVTDRNSRTCSKGMNAYGGSITEGMCQINRFCCADKSPIKYANNTYWEITTQNTCQDKSSYSKIDLITNEKKCTIDFCCGNNSNFANASDVEWVTSKDSRVCPSPYSSWTAYDGEKEKSDCREIYYCCADHEKIGLAKEAKVFVGTNQFKCSSKNSNYHEICNSDKDKDCKNSCEVIAVPQCSTTETSESKDITASACEGQTSFWLNNSRKCSSNSENTSFYSIICTTTVSTMFDYGNDGKNKTSHLLINGTGLKYSIDITTKITCSGEFSVEKWNNSYELFIRKINQIDSSLVKMINSSDYEKGKAYIDKNIDAKYRPEVFEVWRILDDLNGYVENYNDYLPPSNFDESAVISAKYKVKGKTREESVGFIRDDSAFNEGAFKLVSSKSTTGKVKTNKNVYTKFERTNDDNPRKVRLILPTTYLLKDTGNIYNNVANQSAINNKNVISGGNAFYIDYDADASQRGSIKIVVSGLGGRNQTSTNENLSTITNEKCDFIVMKNTPTYRPISLSNPFINSERKKGENWVNSKYDFTNIIKEDTWQNSSLYSVDLTQEDIDNLKKINNNNRNNTFIYSGLCNGIQTGLYDNTANKLCNELNKND